MMVQFGNECMGRAISHLVSLCASCPGFDSGARESTCRTLRNEERLPKRTSDDVCRLAAGHYSVALTSPGLALLAGCQYRPRPIRFSDNERVAFTAQVRWGLHQSAPV